MGRPIIWYVMAGDGLDSPIMEALDAVVALVERRDLDSDYVTEATPDQLVSAARFSTGSAVENRLTVIELIASAFAQRSTNPAALGRFAAGLERVAVQVRKYEHLAREAEAESAAGPVDVPEADE